MYHSYFRYVGTPGASGTPCIPNTPGTPGPPIGRYVGSYGWAKLLGFVEGHDMGLEGGSGGKRKQELHEGVSSLEAIHIPSPRHTPPVIFTNLRSWQIHLNISHFWQITF